MRAFAIETGKRVQEIHQRLLDDNSGMQQLKPLLPLALVAFPFYDKDPCLDGTRSATLDEIFTWTEGKPDSRLFWMNGKAGCGKSTVARTVCRRLLDEERLAGSFFCKRDEGIRRDPIRLISTVAYSLARENGAFHSALLDSLQDPDTPTSKDLQSEFGRMLKTPLSRMACLPFEHPLVFLIDALDECDGAETIAHLLSQTVSITPWIKLIVTSRDYASLRDAFRRAKGLMRELDLFEQDAEEDIRTYLRHEIEHGRLKDIGDPVRACEDDLVRHSGKLFIWIYTGIEFIALEDEGKVERMDALLSRSPSDVAITGIYATYETILEDASKSSELSRAAVMWIVGLLSVTSPNEPLTIGALHAFLPPPLEITLREFETLIHRLSPVLKMTAPADAKGLGSGRLEKALPNTISRTTISAYHLSFLDFASLREVRDVKGDNHANPFWMSPNILHQNMVAGCLEIMEQGTRRSGPAEASQPGLRFNICDLETSHKRNDEVYDLEERIAEHIPSELHYSCKYWLGHLMRLEKGEPGRETGMEKVHGMLEDFFGTERSLCWLEVLSLTANVPVGREILLGILSQPESPVGSFYYPIYLKLTE